MFAVTIPLRQPDPLSKWEGVPEPAFEHHSRFDWGVMLWGGVCPRTGFALEPLEFQFPKCSYSLARINARAAGLADWHKRTHWKVRDPDYDYTLLLDKGNRVFNRNERGRV